MLPDDVRPASFRGVKFEAREVSRSGGKRLVVSKLPQRAQPFIDELERDVRTWRLAAFIVGTADVDADREKKRLIEACEKAGASTLYHPTDGALLVQCESYNVSESSDSLNVVEFSLAFIEAGEPAQSQPDRTSRIKAASARLKAATKTAQRVRRAVLEYGNKTRAVLSGDLEEKAQALGGLSGQFTSTDTSEFSSLLSGMVDTADSLILDSDEECDAWVEAFDALDEPPDRRTVLGALVALISEADTATGVAGLSGINLALAEETLASTVGTHAFALCAAADLVAEETFVAYDDASAALTDMLDALDLDEPYLADSDTLGALQDLRAELLASLVEAGIKLPKLRTLVVSVVTTALELAHALYGDATRADEIVDRNGIADPLAVSGSLLVLTE